jgi:hypothetical protein
MGGFRLIYLAPLLAFVALVAWAFSSPIGSSPDDDFHLASIWCANSANTSACRPGPTTAERLVPPEIKHASCYAHQPDVTAACAARYLHSSSKPTVLTSRGNFLGEYPPVYYATMSLFVGPNIEVSVVVMRIVNVLIFIGMTAGLYLLLPRFRRPTLLWAWTLTILPLGLFLLSSNNPSSWAIIGIGSAWLALLGYFETTGRRRIGLAALFVLAGIMAAGARSDSALYLVISIVVVVLLSAEKTRQFLLRAILPLVMAIVGVFFFFSSQQAGVVATGLGPSHPSAAAPHVNTVALALKDFLNVPQLWSGAFGTWQLGWLDTTMPAIVALAGIVAVVSVCFSGLARLWWRKVVAIVLIIAALWLIPTYVLVKGLNEVGQNVQPRYLLPLIVLCVGTILLTRKAAPVRISRGQLVPVIVLLAVGQCVALYYNLHRNVAGANSHGFDLDTNIKWWWSAALPPMGVWIVGSIAFAALLLVLVREMSRPDALLR